MITERALKILRLVLAVAILAGGAEAYWQINPIKFALHDSTLQQPDAAYDAIIAGAIRASDPLAVVGDHPTSQLRRELRSLPDREPILFVGSTKTPGYLALRLVVSAISWPRPVYTSRCAEDSGGEDPPAGLQAQTALYFHSVVQNGKQILPEVFLVTSKEKKEWESYCPR